MRNVVASLVWGETEVGYLALALSSCDRVLGVLSLCRVSIKSIAPVRRGNSLGGGSRLSVLRASFQTGHGSGFVCMGLAWGQADWLPEDPASSQTALLPLPGYSTLVTMGSSRNFLQLSIS